ncbi:MAG: tetratricopeptide repeat protein, partial [Bacteroidota bacterium]
MKLRQQKNVSFGLLIAFFLQSCLIEAPIAPYPQHEVGLVPVQRNAAIRHESPLLSPTEVLQIQSGPGELCSSDGSDPSEAHPDVADTRDNTEPSVAVQEELQRIHTAFAIHASTDARDNLARALRQLALLHQASGTDWQDLRRCADAATCYQHVLSVCGGKEPSSMCQYIMHSAYAALLKIRKGPAPISMDVAQLREEIAIDRQELQWLRDDAQIRAAELEAFLDQPGGARPEDEVAYIQGSSMLCHDITAKVRAFLARLYRESEEELGPAPCQYAVMGLGSMALEQMTPYSDLAFALLMEACDDPETARTYFKQLTHLVNLRVINLGETQIPNTTYGIHLAHLIKPGIQLDLGGKTPLGRPDRPYELIQTVAGMLCYLKNAGNQAALIDKNLPYILEATCYVHGDEVLYEGYVSQKAAWLADPAIYRSRARSRMLGGAVAWEYNHPGMVAPRPYPQPGHLEALRLAFGMEDEGKLYDVTQEIYRLPDGLLYSLALYHGIVPASGWDAIERLQSCDAISQAAAHHLGYAVSFATMLRLNTYLYHEQRQAGVTMLTDLRQKEAQAAVRKVLCLPREALQTGSSLFKYYYTVLPFHRHLALLFDQQAALGSSEAASLLREDPLYDDADQVNGNIHRRLLQWSEAKNYYAQALDKQRHADSTQWVIANTLHNLGVVCNALKEYPESANYYAEALEVKKQVYGAIHPSVASTLAGLGAVHQALREYVPSISCYLEVLAISKQIYGDIHPAVASSLAGLGTVYKASGAYPQSVGYYAGALALLCQVYGDIHPDVASVLDSLGIVYNCLADYPKSRDHYSKGLTIKRQVYGDVHPAVARSLHKLGLTYNTLREYWKSIHYYSEALAVKKQVYEDIHPSIAVTLHDLGMVYKDAEEYPQSIDYYSEALMIRRQVYGDSHPAVASTLVGLG